ncbi:MAG: DNA polymerase/3'-5' exonuclease PolX [bacterium]|nr:DNA polymerase/3'-5' exonuclease PolX [bacterium]
MDNAQIATLFEDMANLLEIRGENQFKIRAYQNAARAIKFAERPLRETWEHGELTGIKGVGKGIAEKIDELFQTGSVDEFHELKKDLPDGILDLLKVNGMGPKKVKLVYDELGVGSIAELKQAAEAGKLRGLPKMGARSEEKILKAIINLEQTTDRFTLGFAGGAANALLEVVRKVKGVSRAEIAGSLRRGRETVGDVDILASAADSEAVMRAFVSAEGVSETLAQGDTKSSVLVERGLQADLRVVEASSFGAAFHYFTGSKEHNVLMRERAVKRKWKLNEYGLFETETDRLIAGETEEDIFDALGLAWIPPELREGRDEIDLAEGGALPHLIDMSDLRAALHNHTTASDGHMTLAELVEQAEKRGFEIVAVTDHSGSLGVANGLTPDRLKKQIDEIHDFNESHDGARVLAGSEVDIRADGSMDFDDDLLSRLDLVIASVHASFEQPRDKMTARVLRAIENPHVDIIAHPTGRLIGKRPPIELDTDRIFAAAAKHGVAMEINSYDLRLDLNDRLIREAKAHGVRFTINCDTHSVSDFDHLPLGVKMARRGGLKARDVVNTLSPGELMKWLRRR